MCTLNGRPDGGPQPDRDRLRPSPVRHSQAWKCFDADSGKDLAVEVREYFIPDFSDWKVHDAFEKAFDTLLRDLKAEEKQA